MICHVGGFVISEQASIWRIFVVSKDWFEKSLEAAERGLYTITGGVNQFWRCILTFSTSIHEAKFWPRPGIKSHIHHEQDHGMLCFCFCQSTPFIVDRFTVLACLLSQTVVLVLFYSTFPSKFSPSTRSGISSSSSSPSFFSPPAPPSFFCRLW